MRDFDTLVDVINTLAVVGLVLYALAIMVILTLLVQYLWRRYWRDDDDGMMI